MLREGLARAGANEAVRQLRRERDHLGDHIAHHHC
jgi:hypothetical protein